MQQINLLAVLPKPKALPLSSKHMLAAISSFLLVLLIFFGIQLRRISNQRSHLATLQQQQRLLKVSLTQLKKRYADAYDNDMLSNKISALEKSIQHQQRLLTKVNNLQKIKGFSRYMLALAESIPKGVWLTHISINHDNNQIVLQGKTNQSSLLPTFIAALAKTDGFNHNPFRIFKVNQPKEKTDHNYLNFELATKPHEQL